MNLHRGFGAVLLTLACFGELSAADDEKSGDASKAVPLKERFKWTANYLGKVTRVNPGQMTLGLEVQYRVRTLDQGASQRLAQLQQQAAARQAELARAVQFLNPRNAGSVQQVQNLQRTLGDLANRIAQTQQSLYRLETKTKQVDAEAAEDVAVRVPKPPYNFDDKGRLVKYTTEELKELKGDASLWGYPGEFERLVVGRRVQIFLGLPKPAKGTTQTEADDSEYPLVRLIYILDEDP